MTAWQRFESIGEIVGGGDLIRFAAVPDRNWDPPFIRGDNRRLHVCFCQIGDWWKARPAA
jgi:hypothetical protein